MHNIVNTAKAGLLILTLAGAAGCASTSDMDTLQAEIARANETASQAAADAASAQKDAAAARAAAEEARDTATDTNEKLDRMFKKSMQK